MTDFERAWTQTAEEIDAFLKEKLPQLFGGDHPGLARLREAAEYSTYNGGKRFRPVLALWTCELLGARREDILPFAAAIEMVHCYSLIHDDLPCMDDDDLRRGRPSNHKAFGENVALLAGSALLTEAFGLVAKSYSDRPETARKLVETLAAAAGAHGMIGGQMIDVLKPEGELGPEGLNFLHSLKTGALIKSAVVGASCVSEASQEMAQALRKFGEHLGLAFQIADDVLDYDPEKLEPASYPAVMGITKTKKYLEDVTENALKELEIFGEKADKLADIARYNLSRKK